MLDRGRVGSRLRLVAVLAVLGLYWFGVALIGDFPPVIPEQSLAEMPGAVAIVVDDGPSGGQMASTVVDCTGGSIRILRPGPVTMEDLLEGERL